MNGLEPQLMAVDGATLEVFLGGDGEPVVCRSHACEPMSADSIWPWDETMGRLVEVNPRGVGGSSGGQDPHDFTFSQHADDLEAVRQRLGVWRWVLWGESAGAVVALLSALRHPRALRGLILAYMGPSGQRTIEDERSVLSPRNPPNRSPLAALAGEPLPRHPAVMGTIEPRLAAAEWKPLGDQWILTEGDRALIVCPDGEARVWAAFEQFATGFEVQERLGEIQVPARVVAARQDPLIPLDHVEHLAAGLPYAELVVLEESGHGDVDPVSADGARYQAAVRRFLDSLPG
jgi:proline iminopeptidase